MAEQIGIRFGDRAPPRRYPLAVPRGPRAQSVFDELTKRPRKQSPSKLRCTGVVPAGASTNIVRRDRECVRDSSPKVLGDKERVALRCRITSRRKSRAAQEARACHLSWNGRTRDPGAAAARLSTCGSAKARDRGVGSSLRYVQRMKRGVDSSTRPKATAGTTGTARPPSQVLPAPKSKGRSSAMGHGLREVREEPLARRFHREGRSRATLGRTEHGRGGLVEATPSDGDREASRSRTGASWTDRRRPAKEDGVRERRGPRRPHVCDASRRGLASDDEHARRKETMRVSSMQIASCDSAPLQRA